MAHIQALGYRLTELPEDHPEVSTFSVDVNWRGGQDWVVTRNGGDLLLDRNGMWGMYPPRTQWTEQWRSQHHWPSLTEALEAARAALPALVWNGRTAMDVLMAGAR